MVIWRCLAIGPLRPGAAPSNRFQALVQPYSFLVPVDVSAYWQHFRTCYSQWSQRCNEAVRLSPISVNRLNGCSTDRSTSVGDFPVFNPKAEQHLPVVTQCLHPSATDEVPASLRVPIREERKYDRGTRPPRHYSLCRNDLVSRVRNS